MRPYPLNHHLHGHLIVAALGDDNIRIALAGLHELLVHGLDRVQVLIDHALQAAPPIPHVPHNPAQDAHIRIRIHKDLDVHLLAQLAALENQNALHDDHPGRVNGNGLVRAVMNGIVIHRTENRPALLQLPHRLNQQIRVKGVGVVVVQLCPLLIGHVVMGLIVIVMIDYRNIAAEFTDQPFGNGGFAAAGTAGDSDHNNIAHRSALLSLRGFPVCPDPVRAMLIISYLSRCFNLTFAFFSPIMININSHYHDFKRIIKEDTSMIPTPHINAKKEDIAKTVLMPGDPLRAKFIAETYLENPKLVNNVRGIQGYTGTYKGVPVSVMASGMGMPSMAIYSYELFNMYGVENILRVGSAGAVSMELKVRDIVLGQGACTSSSMQDSFGVKGHYAPIGDFELLKTAAQIAEERGLRYKAGNLISPDLFYGDDPELNTAFIKLGALAVEMEAAALYMNAARAGKRALAICTISDHILTGEETTAEERQNNFTHMMDVAFSLV